MPGQTDHYVLQTCMLTASSRPLNLFVSRKSFYEGLKTINNFVEPFIEETLSLSPSELELKTKSDEGYTFLHALASFTRDRKVLRDQLVAVLLAGRDTTAYTLSWLFYELSCHPEVLQKLRCEISEVLGLQRPPTYADLKSMKYLQVSTHNTRMIIRPLLLISNRTPLMKRYAFIPWYRSMSVSRCKTRLSHMEEGLTAINR